MSKVLKRITFSNPKFQAQGYLARKSFLRKFFKYVYLSFLNYKIILKSASLTLFKFNKLMVVIGKKSAPDDHEYNWKIDLQVVPCKMFLCLNLNFAPHISCFFPNQPIIDMRISSRPIVATPYM